jgi:hypothetical protein
MALLHLTMERQAPRWVLPVRGAAAELDLESAQIPFETSLMVAVAVATMLSLHFLEEVVLRDFAG